MPWRSHVSFCTFSFHWFLDWITTFWCSVWLGWLFTTMHNSEDYSTAFLLHLKLYQAFLTFCQIKKHVVVVVVWNKRRNTADPFQPEAWLLQNSPTRTNGRKTSTHVRPGDVLTTDPDQTVTSERGSTTCLHTFTVQMMFSWWNMMNSLVTLSVIEPDQ